MRRLELICLRPIGLSPHPTTQKTADAKRKTIQSVRLERGYCAGTKPSRLGADGTTGILGVDSSSHQPRLERMSSIFSGTLTSIWPKGSRRTIS